MSLFKNEVDGHLGGSVTEPLPSAPVVIPGSGIDPQQGACFSLSLSFSLPHSVCLS